MTDKELRKLKRADLIEILYYLKKENEELTEENQKLKDQLYALVGDAIRLHRQIADLSDSITMIPDGTSPTEHG